MDGAVVHSRKRTCPKCGAATVTLPLFTTRRRSPVTCTSCGSKLERVLPGVPYYTLAFITGMLAEVAAVAMVILGLLQQWPWTAAIVVGMVLVNLAVSAFLNPRTRVQFAEPKDARQDRPGRWYPKSPDE